MISAPKPARLPLILPRSDIEREVGAACGSRRREVWINSGDHDIVYARHSRYGDWDVYGLLNSSASLSAEFERVYRGALAFAESLAPVRAWHSRNWPAEPDAMARIELWVRRELSSRPSWRYIDHNEGVCVRARYARVGVFVCVCNAYATPAHDTRCMWGRKGRRFLRFRLEGW